MNKELKSKEELRALILGQARTSHHFAVGMDVSVRATGHGWGVDCLPPTASRLAFTECCDHIADIVRLLRQDFDLKTNQP